MTLDDAGIPVGGPAAEPVVDLDTLRVLDEETGDIGIAAESVELFLGEYDSNRQALTQALAADDRSEVARVSHRLKSSAAMVGAFRLAQIMGELERTAVSAVGSVAGSAAQDVDGLRGTAAAGDLEMIWDKTQRELQAFLALAEE
ncbi:MAG: Hpt domain-containing protein [Actinomycetes bacterium]